MSYQGGPAPGNGYWPGHGPQDAYGLQDRGSHPPQNHGPPRYQAPTNIDGQYWTPNSQIQHGISAEYSNGNGSYPSAPAQAQPPQQQFQQPQFISPAQLLQQPSAPPRHPQQHANASQISNGQRISNISPSKLSTMGNSVSAGSQPDMCMLLVSLAEEYFEAAHQLTATHTEAYEELIATGLGCLDTALKRVKMGPRTEAKIRLRFAGVLFEETENSMEAETALSKGIALCERNHYYDLKYAMQFLLAQFMAKKNPKASMKALDSHISEAEAFQHYSWVYVFRFLRATHALESGNVTDHHAAIQNLRAVAKLAEQQNDRPIRLTASLMEAMACLKSASPESMEHAQRAIAAAWSFQMDASCKIPQLVGLTHILDVICCIKQGNAMNIRNALGKMQAMMDQTLKDSTWSKQDEWVAIPIRRTPKSSHVVSQETRSILSIGIDGGDNLMMSFLNMRDVYSISYLISGLALSHGERSKGLKFLKGALDSLLQNIQSTKKSSGLIPNMILRRQWLGKMICYVHIYIAFSHATVGDWSTVKLHLDLISDSVQKFGTPLDELLAALKLYLDGVYHQGIGEFDIALQIYQDERLKFPTTKSSTMTPAGQIHRDIAILAYMNMFWTLQDIQWFDPNQNAMMIERLEQLCLNHPDKDLVTAFHIIKSTVKTNPPTPMIQIKTHLKLALDGSQTTANKLFLCITLSVMCSRFFSGVVGDQSIKSAMSASQQASNVGNALWMSVADGMLAQCYDVHGRKGEAQATMEQAQAIAQKAFPSSWSQ